MRSPNKGPQRKSTPGGDRIDTIFVQRGAPGRIRASRAGIAATVQCRGATRVRRFRLSHRAVRFGRDGQSSRKGAPSRRSGIRPTSGIGSGNKE
ncbi:hypothetical protein TNCT_30201 [Trichonephila clavata]|uniref:Uncharacterized protein n=1 Tax=Trichonephila clavata TaxID=2740835 RepID=A0A8X6KMW1_TRICU|nr:hypothetical protein TNCT_30201 [Trichonephila clavata]